MSMCDWCQLQGKCYQQIWQKNAVINGDLYCEKAKIKSMPIISMAYVTAAFCNKAKTVTRRDWSPVHAEKFKKGDHLKVYNKSPQWKGECIGIMELKETPFRERTGIHMGTEESRRAFYKAEGFKYLDDRMVEIEDTDFRKLELLTMNWLSYNVEHWVVPFDIIEVFPGMKEKYSTDEEIIRCVNKLMEKFG